MENILIAVGLTFVATAACALILFGVYCISVVRR